MIYESFLIDKAAFFCYDGGRKRAMRLSVGRGYRSLRYMRTSVQILLCEYGCITCKRKYEKTRSIISVFAGRFNVGMSYMRHSKKVGWTVRCGWIYKALPNRWYCILDNMCNGFYIFCTSMLYPVFQYHGKACLKSNKIKQHFVLGGNTCL